MVEYLQYLFECQDMGSSNRQEGYCESTQPVVSKKNCVKQVNLRPDNKSEIEIFTETYGELQSGQTIMVDLHELLKLIPKQRKRADGYKALKGELKRRGVELIITSRRSSNNGRSSI